LLRLLLGRARRLTSGRRTALGGPRRSVAQATSKTETISDARRAVPSASEGRLLRRTCRVQSASLDLLL
jgi:hypothetical protein